MNAVDAELMLQFAASLIRNLGCRQQSDVNLDSVTNAIDASLTLQYDATLIGSLPPNQVHR